MYELEFFDKSRNRLGKVEALSASIKDSFNSESVVIAKVPAIVTSPTSGKTKVSPGVTDGFYDEWNPVNVYLVSTDANNVKTRTLRFSGYVRNSDDYTYYSDLEIVDFWGYAELKKLPAQDFSDDPHSGTEILTWAINYINSVFDTGLKIESRTTKTTETKIEFGNSLNDVLSRLVQDGFEITLEGDTIVLGEFLGRDLTGDDGVTLKYSYKSPDSANISLPKRIKRTGVERANAVYWKAKDGSGISRSETAEDEIAVFRDYSDTPTDQARTRAEELIASNDQADKEIDLLPVGNALKVGDVLPGDLIRVRIESFNPLLTTDALYRVIEIKTDGFYANSIGQITVGNQKIREYGEGYLLKEIRRLQARV